MGKRRRMETEYVRAVVNGKKIHAQIDNGEITGIDAWIVSLCGISKEELGKLIAWLTEIKEKIG